MRMAKIQKRVTTRNTGKDGQQQELPFSAAGNARWLGHFGKQELHILLP